jgi:O-antigen/teichoic acid export membrane protein
VADNGDGSVAPRLRHNIGWVFLGNAGFFGAQWANLVILAALGNADDVGAYALGLAIASPVFFSTNLNLRALMATDVQHSYRFGEYLGLRLVTVTASLLIVVAISMALDLSDQARAAVIAVGISKCMEGVSFVFYGLFLQRERMRHMGISLLARGALGTVALAAVMAATHDVALSVLAIVAMWAVVIVVHDVPRGGLLAPAGGVRPRWNAGRQLSIARLALPLGIGRGVGSLTTNLPRYLVEGFLGTAALGVFAAIAAVVRAVDLISAAVAQALIPRLAHIYAAERVRRFLRLLWMMTGLSVAASAVALVAAALFGEPFLELLYGAEYVRRDVLLLVTVAAGLAMLGRILGATLMAVRWLKVHMLTMIATAIAVVTAGVMLIPSHGLGGAALSLIIGYSLRIALTIPALSAAVSRLDAAARS